MPTIIFRGEREPLAVNERVANAVKQAKKDGDNLTMEASGTMFEVKDVKFVKEISGRSPGKMIPCENSCGRDYHGANDICPKAYTGSCSVCGKQLWERDRDYAMMKWNKVVCREHSPMGEVEREIGISGPDPLSSVLVGYVTAKKQQGMTTEEAITEIQSKLSKIK